MFTLPRTLSERSEPIRVGVIGAGVFGTNVIDSVEHVPGMTTAAVADKRAERATVALEGAGVAPETIETASGTAAVDDAITAGVRAVATDGLDVATADLDVIVEATGLPSAGARHAFTAITNGTHVVMVNAEADTIVGPLLARLAEANSVVYSLAYGDQPAEIVELCDWAETVGLDVVAAGKGDASRPEHRFVTPEEITDHLGFSEAFIEDRDINTQMYTSFVDGTKIAVEMCAVANATGLVPDVPGMHLPTAEIPELVELFRPESDGGILTHTGIVDTVRTLRSDGSPVAENIGFGVFVVTRAPSDRVRQYLQQYAGKGFHVANDGEYQVFYKPYHLPGLETTVSIASAALRDEPTGSPQEHHAEVVAAAKRDLDPGEEIDGGGGYTVYGRLESAGEARRGGYVPFELLAGAEVVTEIEQDETITDSDVRLDDDTFLYHLRRIQDALL